jgi:transcriptional regulator with XRE-family HTH domain
MEQHGTALTPTQVVAARMKKLREKRGWTAAELARQMKAAGIPWERIVVTKLETGRRASVSVDELLALAAVLNVAPVHLLVPPDDFMEPCQVTPAVTERAVYVRHWIRGEIQLPGADFREYFAEVPSTEYKKLVATAGTGWALPPGEEK